MLGYLVPDKDSLKAIIDIEREDGLTFLVKSSTGDNPDWFVYVADSTRVADDDTVLIPNDNLSQGRWHKTNLPSSLPTNYVTTDTYQEIPGEKFFRGWVTTDFIFRGLKPISDNNAFLGSYDVSHPYFTFWIATSGKLNWGDGSGQYLADTFLYRDGINSLRTNGRFQIDGSVVTKNIFVYDDDNNIWQTDTVGNVLRWLENSNVKMELYDSGDLAIYGSLFARSVDPTYFPSVASILPINNLNLAFGTYAENDTYYAFTVSQDGTLKWGEGGNTNDLDTTLYRAESGSLKTDGDFVVGGSYKVANTKVIGVQQPAIANPANNVVAATIGNLPIGTTYNQTEIQALRNQTEALRDALESTRSQLVAALNAMRNHGLIAN